MLSTSGEELADGVGESDTLIKQEESVLVGSSNRKIKLVPISNLFVAQP